MIHRSPSLRPFALAALAACLLLPGSDPARGQDAPGPPAAVAADAKGPAGLPWAAAEAHGGRLEVLPSGMAILHLQGTPEEMGRQHGTLLRGPVRWLVEHYLPKVLRGERDRALASARALEPQIPERHRREMAAMAEAAGVPYDDILLGSVVVELLGLNQCSGLVAWGATIEGGGTVVGRNLEWPDLGMLGQYGLLVAARPKDLRPYLSVGFPAMVGVVTGMNGTGVFAGELVVLTPVDGEKARKGVPYPILLRRLMEECGSLAEAVALVKASPLTVGQNLLLAGPGGGMVLECAAGKCDERPAIRPGLTVVTNHYNEPASPPKRDPRFERMCRLLGGADGTGPLTVAGVEESLRAGGKMAAFMNLQSGLFFPETLRIRISIGKPPAVGRPYEEVDAAALLGATPVGPVAPPAAGVPGGAPGKSPAGEGSR